MASTGSETLPADMRQLGLLIICLAGIVQGAETLAIVPNLQRLDLKPADIAEVTYVVHAPAGTTLTAALADCACLRVLTAIPVQVGPSGALDIRLRVTGMRPGMEDIQIATTAGMLRAQVQIVGPGAGRGLDQLKTALADAAKQGWRVLAVAHDLHGQVRNCGCSQGALGGAGRLSRLPSLAAEMQPTTSITWVLSGDIDGKQVGVATALVEHGWKGGDTTVRVSPDPLPLLAEPGIVAVIPSVAVAVEHRRIVRPVLSDGMAVELLLVDAGGAIQARRTMPVDDSLPDDPAVALRFRDVLTSTIKPGENPSQACMACHPTAFAAWQQSRHAHALESLKTDDRTDGCISCHSTPIATSVLAPGVSCQSCHAGSYQHVASQGTARTSGTTDCRTCHDARHNPAFQREPALKVITHGREQASPR